jgi:Glycosyl transferase family 2
MNKPLVSVVMVVCNADRFLAVAIESILNQTFQQFEFIIVDFGSSDRTKAIISGHAAKDSRIRFSEIPPCTLPEARNAGCSLAQGQYIAIMDADDISVANRLRWEVDFMEGHPHVGLLGGARECIDGTGRSLAIDDFPIEDHEIKLALAVQCQFCQPTLLIRRDAFVRAGGYRPAFAQAEDYDLALRMSEDCDCANLEQVVLKYRIHLYQLSLQKGSQQTLCKLAAQASASLRRDGKPDPLNSVAEITPAVVAALGVSDARQEREIAWDRRLWIQRICMAGEYAVALEAALELLGSNFEYTERWQIADLRFLAARLYWKQRRFAMSCLTVAHAFMTRPIVVGRPLKPLLQWFRFRNHRQRAPSWKR